MPHGQSWFSVLLGTFYENVERTLQVLGRPFAEPGQTWIAHGPITVGHVFAWVFVLLLVVAIGAVAGARVRRAEAALVPEVRLDVRTFVELLVEATYGQMKQIMGPEAARYFLPLIGTCAFLILFSNAMGLVPGFEPPTSNLNTTLACGLVIFVTTHVYGVRHHGLAYLKHFLGPIVKWYALPLMVLMLVIELVSHFARPASLAIRLMANMTADHMVLAIFLGLVPFVVPLPMYVLGSIVVVVQTLVFCLLSTVYISMAIAHEEH
ncbi:MAG: F0F1 ATP synthase subunit A [Myxococcota bacterium]|nr:F0F1 ATP synthase subunit A [Myxococcota bacterium]MDW8363382.1 F0F1 ATP synthase subunit A [Myxococcales bacterium]